MLSRAQLRLISLTAHSRATAPSTRTATDLGWVCGPAFIEAAVAQLTDARVDAGGRSPEPQATLQLGCMVAGWCIE